jgi:Family of unknown function (DUF5906)
VIGVAPGLEQMALDYQKLERECETAIFNKQAADKFGTPAEKAAAHVANVRAHAKLSMAAKPLAIDDVPSAAEVPTVTTAAPIPLPPNEAPAAAPPETGHGSVITPTAQAELFKGCVYVQDVNQIMTPDGLMLKRETFDNDPRYCGRSYVVERDGTGPTDSAWECFTQSKCVKFPKVRGMFFDPREKAGVIVTRDGLDFVNTWRPLNIKATPGDVGLFTDHIKRILPNGDDALILTSYLAACVQSLGHKASWAIFLQGVEGNGKSFFTKVLQYCLGKIYVHHAAADDLGNNFNAAFYGKLLVCVEEVMVNEGKESLWNKLKTMITDRDQEITSKGVDKVTRELCFNFIFNSNHKDGLRKTANDRRICPLFTAQQTKFDLLRDGMIDSADSEESSYFDRLWAWSEAGGYANVLHYLRTFEIPARYDFARGAKRAPRTTSTEEALEAGVGSIEQDILEAIKEGKPGFRGGWIASHSLKLLIDSTPKGKFIAPNKRRDMLKALGYVTHPGLPDDGRVPVSLPDGQRPRLFIKPGHPFERLKGVAVAPAYLAAQSEAPASEPAAAPVRIPPPPPVPYQ